MSAGPLLSPTATVLLAGVIVGLIAMVVGLAVFAPRVLAIVRRDLAAFFTSPVAYVTLLFYAIFGGNRFYSSIPLLWQEDEPTLTHAFIGLLAATLLVGPVLTMRLFAEERDRGTLELILTTVTRPWEVMLGKYIAAMSLYATLIGLSLFYYLAVVRCLNADIDHGQALAGLLGLLIFGSGLVSIGLMVSAFCRNSMSAVVFTLAIFFGLLFLDSGIPRIKDFAGRFVTSIVPGASGVELGAQAAALVEEALRFVSLSAHMSSFLTGRLDMRDLAYHASLTIFCMVMVLCAINSRRA